MEEEESSMSPPSSPSSPSYPLVPSSGSKSRLCPVCEESPNSHKHYGGVSCLSCKAFFRRAVTSKASSKGKTCRFRRSIDDENILCGIRKCGVCRLVKCFRSGMNPDLVLSGKKEALKHIGRVNEDTLLKLKKLAEDDEDESMIKLEVKELDDIEAITKSKKPVLEALAYNETNIGIDQIVPSLQSSPQLDLLFKDTNISFITSLGRHFRGSLDRISIFSDMFTVKDLLAPEPLYCPALVFTCLQVCSFH